MVGQVLCKVFVTLAAASIGWALVESHGYLDGDWRLQSMTAAAIGAAVGVGGIRLCTGTASGTPWLLPLAVILILLVGGVGGACAAGALAPPVPLGEAEDGEFGVCFLAFLWSFYSLAGTTLGLVGAFLLQLLGWAGIV
jgi:hypothetical protein